jgi:glycosyltransferase involved in cell wall biosynthesis
MRITVLMPMSIERPSGRRYFHLAREFVCAGHTVRLLALHPDFANCSMRRFVADGVEVWYVGQMHARKHGSMPQRFGPLQLLWVVIHATLGMIWGIICSPADVYHLGKPQPVNGLAALIGVMLLRRQRFFVDCDDDEVASNRLTTAWQRAIFGFWQWLLPRIAAGVTVNTQFLAERMRRRGIAPVVYVPNGVDLAQFRRPPAERVEQLRLALGLTGRRVVVYVGTLALQNHPVDLLIDAFALVAERLPDTVLLLIGGGEDLALLRQRVCIAGLQDRVYFTGHIDYAYVRNYLALAEVTVDPVRDDTAARARSPLKLFESMALGVPVVTGDVGDRAALLDYGRAGVVVPAGDAIVLAEKIMHVLIDAFRKKSLVQACQYHIDSYDWQKLTARWLHIYAYRQE